MVESDRSAIEVVDALVSNAILCGASDVHIESTPEGARVRYRIDSILYDQGSIDSALTPQVISRFKILSRINSSERRVPQDGKFTMTVDGHAVDLRLSTFPSIHGEKIVIRILDRSKNMINLESLGFNQDIGKQFRELIHRSSGFFLVTGPTGSGKTTTLYAALSELNSPQKNIITLEDPVEYDLAGITQGQIYPDVGFTFKRGIRALLRQDPDVAMIGEIRDKETAEIAIEAALTGHSVFSTLHTNDAPGAIMRLMDMGIEPFLINASLSGVLAQRLARKICSHCKMQVDLDDKEKKVLEKIGADTDVLYVGKGCEHCFDLGYKGRVGIFELLMVNSNLRSLIVDRPVFDTIYHQVRRDGMKTLLQDGIEKMKEGVISLQELCRVLL